MSKLLLLIDLIHSKIGYTLALLSSYSSLDLSKRINDINNNIDLIKKSLLENKNYIDIRNVIKLRDDLKELQMRLNNDIEVSLQGHKIACVLFETSTLIKLLVLENQENLNEEMLEYFSLASKYLYDCGRIVNLEILCFENKL